MKFDIETAFYDAVKNTKLDCIKCPTCDSSLGSYSFKELHKLGTLFCPICEVNVTINMDKVDNKFKL